MSRSAPILDGRGPHDSRENRSHTVILTAAAAVALLGAASGCASRSPVPSGSRAATTLTALPSPSPGVRATLPTPTLTPSPSPTGGSTPTPTSNPATAPFPLTWVVAAGSDPTGLYSSLAGVACPDADDCWGVGWTSASGSDEPLIEQYRAGTSGGAWIPVSAPSVPTGRLDAVACTGSDDCWAVGSTGATTDVTQSLVEHYTSGGWEVAPAPATGKALTSVACADPDDCWASGGSVFEQYTGDGWSVVPTPAQPPGSQVLSVACPDTDGCWAVGFTVTGTDWSISSLILENTGGGWQVVGSPAGASDGQLLALTCVSSADCWAVGGITSSDGVILHYANGAWSSVPTPTGDGSLDAVGCGGTDDCWAAGSLSSGEELLEEGTPSGWTLISSPTPPQYVSFAVTSMACPTDDACWAVGSSYIADDPWSSALIEKGYGS